MKRALCIVLSAVLLFTAVQGIGSYLVRQLSTYNQAAPISPITEETRVVKHKVLRLEPMEYYSIQVGSFSDTAQGQQTINNLAELGYRVFVSAGPPYKLWLGCSSAEPQLPAELVTYGQDVHVEKQMLNLHSLKFAEDDALFAGPVSSLISSYDVVIKHSLTMFQSEQYGQYTAELWQQMIVQIDSEMNLLLENIDQLLEDESAETIAGDFVDLSNETKEYQQSLQLLANKKNDKAVLLAQSYLLQVIDQYEKILKKHSGTITNED